MKKLTCSLDEKSIDRLIKSLKVYGRELDAKAKALLDLMLQCGEDYAINQVGHVDSGETLSSIHGYRFGDKGVIVAGGNAIWLEFGAGVRYNGAKGSSPHPKGGELGMKIGEYGLGHGADPNGWWYYDESGQVHHTYGIAANMFMWKTARELERVAPELAREVFQA